MWFPIEHLQLHSSVDKCVGTIIDEPAKPCYTFGSINTKSINYSLCLSTKITDALRNYNL